MKKDTFYFSHDYNANSDTKILFLRQQLGMEGYGIYWYLIESLAQAGGKLPFKIIPVLAMQMQVPEIKVKAVIDQFELFKIFEDGFYSERLNEHLQVRKTLSIQGYEGAKKRWNNVIDSPPIALPNGDPNAKERKGKEIKGNESKVNKRESFESFWKLYDKAKNRFSCEHAWVRLTDEEVDKIFKHVPDYVKSTPDKKFRKDPETYLISKGWEDEIILPKTTEDWKLKYKPNNA